MSLKKELYNNLTTNWINGGEFERLADKLGFKGSNASRRMRELVNEGKVERMIKNGSVWYRRPLYPKSYPVGLKSPCSASDEAVEANQLQLFKPKPKYQVI